MAKSKQEPTAAPLTPEQEPTAAPAPKSDKVVIYSKAYSAKFSKLLKGTRPSGLNFENGVAVVTKEELAEVKKSEYWNRFISDKKFSIAEKKALVVTTSPSTVE